MMKNENMYIFKLSYENRTQEKKFIKSLINTYDKNLIGSSFFINNNIYSQEFYYYINFDNSISNFNKWLNDNFPEYVAKIFTKKNLIDLNFEAFQGRYNMVSSPEYELDSILTKEANNIFIYPDKDIINTAFNTKEDSRVNSIFLSHKSEDKKTVEVIFNQLRKKGINVFFDKFEINASDDIHEKINSGLQECTVCILCVSKHLNYATEGWVKTEIEFFKKANKKILALNLDLSEEDMQKQIGNLRYINYAEPEYLNNILHFFEDELESYDFIK